MRKARLRWFEHIKRRRPNALGKKSEMIDIIDDKRGRCRPKKSWNEVVIIYINHLQLLKDMTQDRTFLRF